MSSIWHNLRGHHNQIEMFRRAISRGRLAQGYLFVGAAGIGKRSFARTLAMCLFCERHSETDLDACGECSGCRQMAAGSHPDYFEVGCPEGKRELPISVFLGEEDERGRAGLCYQLSLSPTAGGRRIAVIDDADAMNDAAANAFLKTLEEPQPGAVLILIARQADELLPTIRSRCQQVRFAALAEQDVAELLLEAKLADVPALAGKVAAYSDGSFEVASRLADPAMSSLQEVVVSSFSTRQFDPAATADKLIKGIEPFSDLAAQREATVWIARFAAKLFQQATRALLEDTRGEAGADSLVNLLRELDPHPADSVERLSSLLESAAAVEDQLSLYASPVLCIEAFAYGIAAQLRS